MRYHADQIPIRGSLLDVHPLGSPVLVTHDECAFAAGTRSLDHNLSHPSDCNIDCTGSCRIVLAMEAIDNISVAQLENFRLKVFRAVAEHLNFRRAAEHLFLSQPAVTLQIKALETDLGIRLFDRSSNRVDLTRQGAILLRYAERIAALTSEAEQELGVGIGEFSGELSLGASTTIAQY